MALWQAHHVQRQLLELGLPSEIKIIKTTGDKIQHLSFDKIEGKGFFTKEIEEALLAQEIDLAVHSHKDLETQHPEGLCIAAVSPRANPGDLILIRKEKAVDERKWKLAEGAVVGTSSARRKGQLLHHCPKTVVKDLRGNVPTRIQKLRDGLYDAIILASAGVERLALDLSDLVLVQPDVKEFVPAPAQGVLGLQTRSNDHRLINMLAPLNDAVVASCIEVERGVLAQLHGGCHLPFGAFCRVEDKAFTLYVAHAADAHLPMHYYQIRGTKVSPMVEEMMLLLKKKDLHPSA